MSERHGVVSVKGNPMTLVGAEIRPGDRAPDFAVLKGDMSPFSLAENRGKITVINSVPSLDTAVCANQARRFNLEAGNLGTDVKVVVVSMDLPFAQGRFCSTEGIANLVTVSDHREASFGQNYGLLIKELRLLARAVVVVDREGMIRYLDLVPEIGQEPDYDAALKAIRELL